MDTKLSHVHGDVIRVGFVPIITYRRKEQVNDGRMAKQKQTKILNTTQKRKTNEGETHIRGR
jgi:hypothetical protein